MAAPIPPTACSPWAVVGWAAGLSTDGLGRLVPLAPLTPLPSVLVAAEVLVGGATELVDRPVPLVFETPPMADPEPVGNIPPPPAPLELLGTGVAPPSPLPLAEVEVTPVVLLLVLFFPAVPPTAPPTTAAMMMIATMTTVIFPLVVERKDLLCGAPADEAARGAYFSRGVALASMSLSCRGGVRAAGGVTLPAGAAAPAGR